MRLQFSEIPAEGLRLTIGYGSWFPDEYFSHCSDVNAIVAVDRNVDHVLVTGEIETLIELDCDRCLDKFEFMLDVHFRLVLELSGDESLHDDHGEYACISSDMDTVFLDEPVVDLESILQHQVFLSIPLKRICQSNCRGLCCNCGVNLNSEQCGCADEHNESPFGVLGKLKG